MGFFEINPSRELSATQAKVYSSEISQMINNRESYAYVKSFGYYGPEVSTKDILDILQINHKNKNLPYHD